MSTHIDSMEELKDSSTHLSHNPPQTMKEQLLELADYLGEEKEDYYGKGRYLEDFEKEVAQLLGKEAAVFLISGTLALQVAMRIWCERKGNFRVAFHPESHIEMAQYNGYNVIHHIRRVQFSAPERLNNRLVTLDDFKNIKEPIAVVVIELPQRSLAQLPSFEELKGITDWCREKGIATILDGARLWESQPYLGRSLSEICELFDTVYVSFYKGLNNLAGCALLGDRDLIKETKVWQRRSGAGLKTQFPYVVSAKIALSRNLKRIPLYVERAGVIASFFEESSHFTVTPYPVHTNMFNVIVDVNIEECKSAVMRFARDRGIWLLNPVQSFVDRHSQAEITIAENAMSKSIEEWKEVIRAFDTYL